MLASGSEIDVNCPIYEQDDAIDVNTIKDQQLKEQGIYL